MAETISRSERADRTAMWRWGVIRDAIDPVIGSSPIGGSSALEQPPLNGGWCLP
jgi:hypothetical protein